MDQPKPNTYNYLELSCADPKSLAASKKFFSELFGWNFKDWGDSYADTHDSGLSSGLSAVEEGTRKPPLPVLYVTNLEETKQRVISAGGEITADIFPFPGGRRFHFREPSGSELAAWSDK